MIQEFVDRFESRREELRARLSQKHPEHYGELVKMVVESIGNDDDWRTPDPERIHAIDDGDYQGTLVYVIGETGYQPSGYWGVTVSYGSCSGCDTLQSIRSYEDFPPSEQQVDDYMTLMLHIVQNIKSISTED